MGNASTVARNVRLYADRQLSPAALSANLAATAIRTRDDVVRRGDAPPSWITYVDGRRGVPEASVRPDGAILYRFNLLGLAAAYAVAFCKARSPVKSGAFRRAWAVVVDGKPWTDDLNDIPADAEIMVVNPLPYARKVEVGAMKMKVPPGIVEGARLATRRQYPTLEVDSVYVNIPSGLFARAPWILKNAAGSRRKDRQSGMPITYPALIMSERT